MSNLDQSQPNEVTKHDDYIEVVWHGAQSVAKIKQTSLEIIEAADALTKSGKPVRLSIWIKDHPKTPNLAGFREDLKIFRVINFDRMAICGDLPPVIMTLVLSIIQSFNKEIEIMYFHTPEEALVWLRRN